jgi:hypothetical protein
MKKAEFEIWFDSLNGEPIRVDDRHNAMAYPQERVEARQSARYFAESGVWISSSVLIPPSQITRIYLKKAATE